MISLLQNSTLTISRDEGAGSYDASGRWVPDPRASFDIQCNIQPFKMSNAQEILPEGKKSGDALVVYTKTDLQTVSQFDKELADTTTIDGLTYYAFAVENWSRQGTLQPQHYKVIFVRKDKATGGSL